MMIVRVSSLPSLPLRSRLEWIAANRAGFPAYRPVELGGPNQFITQSVQKLREIWNDPQVLSVLARCTSGGFHVQVEPQSRNKGGDSRAQRRRHACRCATGQVRRSRTRRTSPPCAKHSSTCQGHEAGISG